MAVVSEFIEEKRYRLSRKTVAFYEDMIGRAFLRFLVAQGIHDVAEITPPLVVAYLNEERPRLAPATFAGRFAAAKHFFAWCVEMGYLASSPMEKMRRPKVPKEGRFAFSREETQAMWKVCEAKPGVTGIRDRAVFLMLIGTGCRCEGIVNLTVDDLDWAHRQLTLREKGQKERTVRMGPKLAGAMREWLRARRKWGVGDSGPVFWTQLRQPMRYSAIESFVGRLGDYASVSNCHPHRFRHTAATEMFRQHRNLIAVQEFLGHEKIETTMTYLRQLRIDYRENIHLSTPDEFAL